MIGSLWMFTDTKTIFVSPIMTSYKSENRLLHKESKRDLDWSESEMRVTSEKYRLNSYEGEELPFENYMKLDNTNLAPDEVAKMIKAHFAIEE